MITILQGDVLDKLAELPDNSVHTCITSPPYWGLRDYGVAGQIGLEKTPEEYIAKMVTVFRDVKRVLRDDGTLWLNLGDSYANCGSSQPQTQIPHDPQSEGYHRNEPNKQASGHGNKRNIPDGLKPKDLCGIPWRVALALQADGWWLRSDIIWAKPNPMPESVTDRPTKSHEYIFLLTKSQRYYYDAEAVKEKVGEPTRRAATFRNGGDYTGGNSFTNSRKKEKDSHGDGNIETGRNLRSVWDITTKGYAEAHFATFPPDLPERCIKAGTSEKGVCSKCGAGWVRSIDYKANYEKREKAHAPKSEASKVDSSGWKPPTIKQYGFIPSCTCNADVIPATVLDPFAGSGTTGQVAERLGRNATLIELNPKYIGYIKKRTHHTNLFCSEVKCDTFSK